MHDLEPQYKHIQHHWSEKMHLMIVRIRPGEVFVSNSPNHVILTTLGSCISACIQDVKKGIGGMNHFMLPEANNDGKGLATSPLGTYGNHAMELLINDILKRGGDRQHFELKLFGGGNIGTGASLVSENNINFIKDYATKEKLQLKSIDVGGNQPRKIVFLPFSGIAKVKRLKTLDFTRLERQEKAFIDTSKAKPKQDDIELF